MNETTLSKKSSTRNKWLGGFPSVLKARLQLAGVAMLLLLVVGLIMWAVLQSRPVTPQVVKVLPPQTPSPDSSTQQPMPSPQQHPSAVDSNADIAVSGTTKRKSPVPAQPDEEGTGSLSAEIEEALIAKELKMPTAVERLDRTPAITVRGSGSSTQCFTVVRPFATVISDGRPRFRWTALSGATSYTVSVYDAALHLIKESEPLREAEWSMPDSLKAGVVYTWMVAALKDGQETIAPAPPARAEFQILEKSELTKLNRILSRTASHAARGVLYAEDGLLDEAEREFRTHLDLRPADERAKRLLATIKSWRRIVP